MPISTPLSLDEARNRFCRQGFLTLADLANALQGTLSGEGTLPLRRLVKPEEADCETDLAYAVEPDALAALSNRNILAAVLSTDAELPGFLKGAVRVSRPRLALAGLLTIFDRPAHRVLGIHPSAVVDATATIDPSASIGPLCVVGPRAHVGADAVLLAHVTVLADARVGEGCLLHPGVRIGERVVLGKRVILQQNASIGADGFSYVTPEAGSIESARASGRVEAQNSGLIRLNSIGTVILEDDVEVGSCATIDRATLGATIVRQGSKIDNLVMIGHNNTLGSHCLIAGQVGIAGSCDIGDRVVMAGQSGTADHISIGHDAIVMAKAGVHNDIGPKSIVLGSPAVPHREAAKGFAAVARLPELRREVFRLRDRLAALESRLPPGMEEALPEEASHSA